jgi:hypothetical protein
MDSFTFTAVFASRQQRQERGAITVVGDPHHSTWSRASKTTIARNRADSCFNSHSSLALWRDIEGLNPACAYSEQDEAKTSPDDH